MSHFLHQYEVIRDVATSQIPRGIIFIPPSVTPNGYVNPGIRVYYYNRTTFEVGDDDDGVGDDNSVFIFTMTCWCC